MSKKVKIGIIGTGSISSEHIKAYLKNPDAELYALCDIVEDRVKAAAERYGVGHVFTDMNEMLKMKEIDAVSVCTWNSAHMPCAVAALNAGKHVLCEKPMSISAFDAQLMKEAADKNHKLLMIGFVRRFGNDCRILKEFINTDFFGEIYYAKATYLRRLGNPGGWFGNKELSGGGPLIDLGVHVIDFVRYLLGNPKPITVYGAAFNKLGNRKNIKGKAYYKAARSTENDICNVEDLASAMIRFDNGAVLSIETSFSLNTKENTGKIELFGTKGGVKLDSGIEMYSEMNNYMTNVTLDANTTTDFNTLFENEINHFVSCIKDNIPCISPPQDGIDIMTILDAIYESARTGHEAIIKE